MLKILHRYTLREILAPAALFALALLFIFLIGAKAPWKDTERLIFTLAQLFFREGTSKSEVLSVFLLGLPPLAMFIAPMALLIGIIIGVGRMTLDLEVRAIQTGGINLLTIFVPVLTFAALMSGLTLWLWWAPAPRMLRDSIQRGGMLLISEVANLDPGRVYDDLFRDGVNLYFEGRDAKTGAMTGVTLAAERRAFQDESAKDEAKDKRKAKEKEIERRFKKGEITRLEADALLQKAKLSERGEPPAIIVARRANFDLDREALTVELSLEQGSIHILGEASSANGSGTKPKKPKEEKAEPPPGEALADEAGEGASAKDAEKESKDAPNKKKEKKDAPKPNDAEKADEERPQAESPEPEKPAPGREYAIIHFGRMAKAEYITPPEARKGKFMLTIPELFEAMKDPKISKKKQNEYRAEVYGRFSRSLQALVFAFIGLPLAIWIKPTGKSVGILLAMGVILIYIFLLQTGVNMVEDAKPLGPLVVFAPNAIFAVAGVFLWRRTLRS